MTKPKKIRVKYSFDANGNYLGQALVEDRPSWVWPLWIIVVLAATAAVVAAGCGAISHDLVHRSMRASSVLNELPK